ncbi:hypothetical protein NR800_08065 [Corallococcus interemptor]|uniref:hypothetical protein n=1 Tax=Corallococcus TaxID=83461 RepID=UPI0035D3FD90
MTPMEGQSWQMTCRVCGRQTCPKPEAVASWMRTMLDRVHGAQMRGAGQRGLREALAMEGVLITTHLEVWSRALEGVCPDCIAQVAPETDAKLQDPEAMHEAALARWRTSAPELVSDAVESAVEDTLQAAREAATRNKPTP